MQRIQVRYELYIFPLFFIILLRFEVDGAYKKSELYLRDREGRSIKFENLHYSPTDYTYF